MKPLTVLFCGNFKPFWSTENHVRLSLDELGHEVICLQEDEVDDSQVVAMTKATNCDMFLWVRTWGIKNSSFEMLREIQCPTVAFHLDLYAGLKRDGGIDKDPWWNCKYVFSADGGSPEFFLEHGISHFYSPAGVYGGECYISEPNSEWATDILFTGSATGYHPEYPYRQLLLNNLKEHYGDRFRIVEHGSPGGPWRGDKLNQLYASSKVMVGDTLCLNYSHPHYFSDRLFEQAGRGGGCQVFPYIKGIEDMYEIGKEILTYTYGDFDELYSRIDWLLEYDTEREQMRVAALQRTLRDHTYAKRLEKVLDTIAGKEGWK